jgi:NADP-dependent 3-hydroxy acid dehydrogenase YdfG
MKITITGHLSGIGKAMYDGFSVQGHEILGIDRDTIPDLSTDEGIINCASLTADSDMIIINAYDMKDKDKLSGFSQTVLLYRMFSLWKGQDNKIIVVIGSLASEMHISTSNPYIVHKISIDAAVKQLRNISSTKPYILNLKPHYVDTPMTSQVNYLTKMQPIDVFEICDWAIKNKNFIYDVSFRSK